jgi:hypothetical protein
MHIQVVEKCGIVEAQCQLKDQIGERNIPVKWTDGGTPQDLSSLQNSQLILSKKGLAFDGDRYPGKYRPLLVHKAAIQKRWSRTGREEPREKSKIATPSKYDCLANARNNRVHWVTLVRAAEHIQVIEDCNSKEALRQLREEIGDGTVRVKWADADGAADVPDAETLSTSKFVLTGLGLAPSHMGFQPLLVYRKSLEKLWPTLSVEPMAEIKSRSLNHLIKAQHQSRPSQAQIRQLLRQLYQEAAENPPNILDAENLVRGKLPGAVRSLIRPILHEPEFANLRRGAGTQRNR